MFQLTLDIESRESCTACVAKKYVSKLCRLTVDKFYDQFTLPDPTRQNCLVTSRRRCELGTRFQTADSTEFYWNRINYASVTKVRPRVGYLLGCGWRRRRGQAAAAAGLRPEQMTLLACGRGERSVDERSRRSDLDVQRSRRWTSQPQRPTWRLRDADDRRDSFLSSV